MKKFAVRLALVATVFGGVYGLADALNITSTSIGAADTVVAACQSTAFALSFTPTYSASQPGYAVTNVTVAGTTAGCFSKPYKITLADATGVSLGEATGTTSASAVPFTATIAANASLVTNVAVVISG